MKRFFNRYKYLLLFAFLISLSRLPLRLGFMVFFAFVPLCKYLEDHSGRARELWLAALVFAFIQIGLVFYWIGTVTVVGLFGIWLFYTLIYFVMFWFLVRLFKGPPWLAYLALIAFFISFEYLGNFGETRFPWFNLAYSLADYLSLLQALDLGGLSLLAFGILSVNYVLYMALKKRYRCLFWLIPIFGLWLGYGFYILGTIELAQKKAPISVMQPSIPPEDKWIEQNYRQIVARYDSLSALAKEAGSELIIWPEAAIPGYVMLQPDYYADVMRVVLTHDIEVFTGFIHAEKAPDEHPDDYYHYNAAGLFDAGKGLQTVYLKNILVPVGERMLWLKYFPFLWKWQLGQANWEFGTQTPRYQFQDYSFSPSICYELAFPDYLQKVNFKLADGSHKKADFHVNITNDAWFGKSYGPWLHGVMTRFRAIESRIQIYRSANSGISMIVNPLGQELASAPLFEVQNISAPLQICPKIPLYHHAYFYPWFFVALALVLAVIALFYHGRKV